MTLRQSKSHWKLNHELDNKLLALQLVALPTFKEPSRERENTFQKRFKLSKANSQTGEKLLWMGDYWIEKEIKHSILKIGANGKNQELIHTFQCQNHFQVFNSFPDARRGTSNDNVKKRGRGQPGTGKRFLQSSFCIMCHRHWLLSLPLRSEKW